MENHKAAHLIRAEFELVSGEAVGETQAHGSQILYS